MTHEGRAWIRDLAGRPLRPTPPGVTWANTRFQRLLAWGLWRWSPSLMRRPTFREAWTGKVRL